ncbi:MAG: alpha/beta fold hydrolase [Dehalococcoidia bacterium]
MPIERINGIDMMYKEFGRGPTIVWVHGGGGTHLSWFQQIPAFAKDFRCVVIDQRGFGRSTDPDGEGTARFADDLEVLCERLGIDTLSIVAQSMGGITAMDFTVRHQARVSALVMCDTWGWINWPEVAERALQLRTANEANPRRSRSIHEVLNAQRPPDERDLEVAYASGFSEAHPAMALLMNLNFFELPRPSEVGQRPYRVSPYGPEALANLRVPSMFLVGEEDVLVPPEIMRTVSAAIPGAEYVEIKGSGHSVYWEDPEQFNRVVFDFISKFAL